MKKFSVLILSLLVFSFLLNSCSKDESIDESKSVAEDGTLKVDFDGKTFVSTTVQAIVNNSYISITGLRSPNGDFIQLTIPSNKVGTYTWKNLSTINDVLVLAYTPAGGANAYVSVPKEDADGILNYTDTGILTILSIDNVTKKISGTFEFTGVDYMGNNDKGAIKVFTKGSFTNIPFSADVVTPAPTPTSNTFSAKLDGVDFISTNIFATLQSSRISISARKGSVETIGISLPSTIKAGTYTVEAYGMDYVFLYNKDMTPTGSFTGAGSVVITSHDTAKKIIKGTFTTKHTSLFATTTYNVTNGAFSVSY